jgi:hypothetical protein
MNAVGGHWISQSGWWPQLGEAACGVGDGVGGARAHLIADAAKRRLNATRTRHSF